MEGCVGRLYKAGRLCEAEAEVIQAAATCVGGREADRLEGDISAFDKTHEFRLRSTLVRLRLRGGGTHAEAAMEVDQATSGTSEGAGVSNPEHRLPLEALAVTLEGIRPRES